jgi:acyl-CoA oxidase
MQAACRQNPDGSWVLNGNKRWIGNANKDLIVMFARDESSKLVKGFIVPLETSGIKRTTIKRKMALRCVQNIELHFDNVLIGKEWHLPKVVDFSSVSNMLAHSRLCVSMLACGIGVGIYDNLIAHLSQRSQFNRPLLGFQLIQEKLVRIMGNVQASLALVSQLIEVASQGKSSIGRFAMTKAWVTLRMREAASLSREMLGGNGIIIDNYAIKAMMDIEAIYTYEGTYDINCLIAGREMTSLSAFR